MRISFVIPGQLKGKGRHRSRMVNTRDGRSFVQNYTPKETQSHEAIVRTIAATAMEGKPLFVGPVALAIRHFKPHPLSWSKRKKATSFFVTGKPDCSNVLKMLEDGLNGIVWHDDSQIAKLNYARYFRHGPDQTEVEINDELVYPSDVVMDAPDMEPEDPPLFRRLGRRRRAAA